MHCMQIDKPSVLRHVLGAFRQIEFTRYALGRHFVQAVETPLLIKQRDELGMSMQSGVNYSGMHCRHDPCPSVF